MSLAEQKYTEALDTAIDAIFDGLQFAKWNDLATTRELIRMHYIARFREIEAQTSSADEAGEKVNQTIAGLLAYADIMGHLKGDLAAHLAKSVGGLPSKIPLRYDPANGAVIKGFQTYAEGYREQHGPVAWLFNPWTGKQRDPRDIGSDVHGHLIVAKLPEQVDLSDQLPPVEDQGELGASSALALAGALGTTSGTQPQPVQMETRIVDLDKMVERFLSWSLPESFNPDGGISFKKTFNDHLPEHSGVNRPSGTNLFTAVEAREMLEYVLSGDRSIPYSWTLPLKVEKVEPDTSFQYEDAAKYSPPTIGQEMLRALEHVEAVYRLNVVKGEDQSSTLENLQQTIAKAKRVGVEGPVSDITGGPQWRPVWQGSPPQEGWSIFAGRDQFWYLGGDESLGEVVQAMCDAYNASLKVRHPITPELLLDLALPKDQLDEAARADIVKQVFGTKGAGIGVDADCMKRIARHLGWSDDEQPRYRLIGVAQQKRKITVDEVMDALNAPHAEGSMDTLSVKSEHLIQFINWLNAL